MLAAALAAVFVCNRGYGEFRGSHHHDQLSRGNLSVAANLASEHGFLGFYHRQLGADGTVVYKPYNRFPILGHALIRLAGLPFPEDLSAQLAAARVLMLLFYCAAALLGYLTLRRLLEERWPALAATLLAFSSLLALHYADAAAVEGVVDLFAVMLVAHGLAVFAKPAGDGGQRRTRPALRQLLAKIAVALLLGWHVYALLAPFLALAVGAALWRKDWRRALALVGIGAFAVGVGAAVLGVNLAREQAALDPSFEFWELPSARSALRRTGLATPLGTVDANRFVLPPPRALATEMSRRVGLATVPAAASAPMPTAWWKYVGALAAALVAGLMLRPGLRQRAVWAAIASMGFVWAAAMRYSTFALGFFDGLFLVGVPLVGAALALSRLPRPVAPWIAAAAFGVFWWSAVVAAPVADDARSRQVRRAALAEIDGLRGRVADRTVYVGPRDVEARELAVSPDLLFGAVLVTGNRHMKPNLLADPPPELAEFAIVGDAASAFACRQCLAPLAEASLTPDHKHVFLLPSAQLRDATAAMLARYEALAARQAPLASAGYDIHALGAPPAALLYAGDCPSGRQPRFFLHIHPRRTAALTPFHRRYGFENRNFRHNPRWRRSGKCYAVRLLPSYAIDAVRTGQFTHAGGEFRNIWEAEFSLPAGGAACWN